MPFGICSAPEVFQRCMHKLIEGLHRVEVVTDDFVIVGFRDTQEEASHDHDHNLEVFLYTVLRGERNVAEFREGMTQGAVSAIYWACGHWTRSLC